jgi:hypothetical protein
MDQGEVMGSFLKGMLENVKEDRYMGSGRREALGQG